jgi:hypothetical protein
MAAHTPAMASSALTGMLILQGSTAQHSTAQHSTAQHSYALPRPSTAHTIN